MKKRILIISGRISKERAISLDTGKQVAKELIKESVPLDKTFGDACISNKHCNFFINKGNATFNDMKNLIEFVSKKVLEKTGISLEKEIKILE